MTEEETISLTCNTTMPPSFKAFNDTRKKEYMYRQPEGPASKLHVKTWSCNNSLKTRYASNNGCLMTRYSQVFFVSAK